nr:MAG: ORF1 [TTV-like mini virus]
MPYYWRTRYQTWRNRRRRFRRRRPRFTFQRRFWRRRWRRPRNFWVRRRKKLKYIPLKQFQPDVIRRCTIKGTICLFQGHPFRAINNYIQYIYSKVPENEPGGGGWTIMTESLTSLWEDWEHLKNVWTSSNAGLPLVRYGGVTLLFYQDPYTDYIVEIHNCYPMTDTKYQHADLSPSRMLQKRKVIVIPSMETKKRKKNYKKVKVPPPSQMQNKWYFQRDICRIPLILIAATAVSLRYPFASSNAKSNNYTFHCLNVNFFQRHDFDNFSATTGYFPKPNTYMYSTKSTVTTKPTKKSELIYLGDTKDNTPGKGVERNDWGNPFWHHYLDGSAPIWLCTKPPTQLTETLTATDWTELTQELIIKVRYNPENDTGAANTIYLVPNYQPGAWDIPHNKDLIIDGFPLYNLIWGYKDWQEKIKVAQNIDNSWILVINTDQFDQPLPAYVILDDSFIEGFGPFHTQPIPRRHQQHWSPKYTFQQKSANDLGISGPGAPRPPYDNYMQAKMRYFFHMKWGGCPRTLEKPYDPCSQPNWTIPSNEHEGLQIQNPETMPQTELQKWDWEGDYVKSKAIKRIQQYTKTDETLPISTESRHNVPAIQEASQKISSTDSETDTEEEQTSLQEQIRKLKRKQLQLKRHLLKRLKIQNLE